MYKNSALCFESVMGFNDKIIMLVGIPIASMMVSLLLFVESFVTLDWKVLMVCIPMSFLYTTLIWISLRFFYKFIKRAYPKTTQIGQRAVLAFFAIAFSFKLINFIVEFGLIHFMPGVAFVHEPVLAFPATLIVASLVITIYEAISFYLQLEKTTAEKINLEKHYVSSQLEGLRNQVNPHFLFNSLNTLSYLIPEDPDRAMRFVQQLSKVYRYVLESRDSHVIPLQEEMEFLNSYIFLLKERFGNSLKIKIDQFDKSSNIAIVPLSMQLLFENAIKHNVISQEMPLTIEVFRNNGSLVVRNRLQLKNQVQDSTGVGIENIKSRYGMLTEKPVEIKQNADFFMVYLPIIELNTEQ
jgi:two-component system, LytTR family, sensor kinase